MNKDRYTEIRKCYTKFTTRILNSEDENNGADIRRAGKKLSFLKGDTMIFESEDESNVLLEYLLYEKNGKKTRLIDRYSLRTDNEMDKTEEVILSAMLTNYFSVFEVDKINAVENTVDLIDIIEGGKYTLIDIGFSESASEGNILSTRLLPIGDVYMTSGLTFAFTSDKRLRLLREISKKSKYSVRKRSVKLSTKSPASKTLFEIMHQSNRKWGSEVESRKI